MQPELIETDISICYIFRSTGTFFFSDENGKVFYYDTKTGTSKPVQDFVTEIRMTLIRASGER